MADMSTHEGDVVCVGKGVDSSTHCSDSQRDASIQVSKHSKVTLALKKPNSKDVYTSDLIPGTDTLYKRDGCQRSRSARYILQYADVPIEITNHHLGRPTRASILRNLKRSKSASAICSEFSWIQDNRRLCNIRDYYRLYKAEKIQCKSPNGEPIHGFLTGARFNNGSWLDSDSIKTNGLYIDRHTLGNAFFFSKPPEKQKTHFSNKVNGRNLLEVQGKKIMKDAIVNTDENYLSLNKWHGAMWQRHLPQLYQPCKQKYNAHASVFARAKLVKSEYRNPMNTAKEKKR